MQHATNVQCAGTGSPAGAATRPDQPSSFNAPLDSASAQVIVERFETTGLFPDVEDKPAQLAEVASKLLGREGCMVVLLENGEQDERRYRAYCSNFPGGQPPCRYCIDDGKAAAKKSIESGKSLLLRGRIACWRGAVKHSVDAQNNMIASLIQIDGKLVGSLVVIGRKRGASLNGIDISLTDMVAWLVGRSLQSVELERLLNSGFAQKAIAEEPGCILRSTLASQRPNQLSKILARSFYRELVKVGFTSGQIIDAASEIISQLSATLQKHTKRLQRPL